MPKISAINPRGFYGHAELQFEDGSQHVVLQKGQHEHLAVGDEWVPTGKEATLPFTQTRIDNLIAEVKKLRAENEALKNPIPSRAEAEAQWDLHEAALNTGAIAALPHDAEPPLLFARLGSSGFSLVLWENFDGLNSRGMDIDLETLKRDYAELPWKDFAERDLRPAFVQLFGFGHMEAPDASAPSDEKVQIGESALGLQEGASSNQSEAGDSHPDQRGAERGKEDSEATTQESAT